MAGQENDQKSNDLWEEVQRQRIEAQQLCRELVGVDVSWLELMSECLDQDQADSVCFQLPLHDSDRIWI